MTIWLITGASRGFGALITERALAKGDAVVATARNPKAITDRFGEHPNLLAARLDVASDEQAAAAAKAAIDRFGRIDILLNNAGFGLMGRCDCHLAATQSQRLRPSTRRIERYWRNGALWRCPSIWPPNNVCDGLAEPERSARRIGGRVLHEPRSTAALRCSCLQPARAPEISRGNHQMSLRRGAGCRHPRRGDRPVLRVGLPCPAKP